MTGLAAASQAISLLKDLRVVDREVDESTFKLKIADIQMSLADAKIALSDARLKILGLEQKIAALTKGDMCPVCKKGHLKVNSVDHDGVYSAVLELHKVSCDRDACTYTATRIYNTNSGTYTSVSS